MKERWFRNRERVLFVFVVVLLLLPLFACMTAGPEPSPEPTIPQAPPLTYSFSYEPTKEANPAKVNIALGHILIRADNRCPSKRVGDLLSEMASALESAFQATLLAKGYTLSGPFDSREQMTYAEKEKAMLLLLPELTVKCSCEDSGLETLWEGKIRTISSEQVDQITTRLYRAQDQLAVNRGNVKVAFSLDLVLYEPLTGEKLWLKSVKAPLANEPYEYYTRITHYTIWKGTVLGNPIGGGPDSRWKDPNVTVIDNADARPNAAAAALEKLFASSMQEFSKYFDPREIAQVVEDANKVRKLKRY
jgi:hypothetical protein